VRAALEARRIEAGLSEHREDGARVHLLAVVGAAGDGQFARVDVEAFGRARREERQSLLRLGGRADVSHGIGRAEPRQDAPGPVHGDEVAAVHRLDDGAARDLHERLRGCVRDIHRERSRQ
jgi:hypothetical protein